MLRIHCGKRKGIIHLLLPTKPVPEIDVVLLVNLKLLYCSILCLIDFCALALC